ncbi:hypothetical protein [Capnocytophaga canimorsus]|nr:hypothetical protein [Capnocytophaga canimorsus]
MIRIKEHTQVLDIKTGEYLVTKTIRLFGLKIWEKERYINVRCPV